MVMGGWRVVGRKGERWVDEGEWEVNVGRLGRGMMVGMEQN